MKNLRSAVSLPTLVCAFSGLALTAMAQEQPAPEADSEARLTAIIVTAQKTEQSLQDVPISVTAISADFLADSGVTANLELGAITPGLVTIEGSGFYVPFIRGIGSRAITPGNESPVAFYVDGVYQTDKAGLLFGTFNDVDSIQVLRGPQGTLFGRNATAGAVLVETRNPTSEFTAEARVTYGSDETSGAGFISGPIGAGLTASLSGFFRETDPYIRNLNPANGAPGEIGDAKSQGVRAKILWEPVSDFSALLAVDYIDTRDTAPWAPQPIAGTGLTAAEGAAAGLGVNIPDARNSRPVYAGSVPPVTKSDGKGASLTLDWNPGPVSIRSITAYRTDTSAGILDLDASPLPLFFFETALESKVWQQEINIFSEKSGPFSWMAGAYYLDMKDGYTQLDQNVRVPYPYDPAVFATLPAGAAHVDFKADVEIQSLAVFGEVYYDLTNTTSLTLGLRYTDEEHSLPSSNRSITSIPNGSGGILTLPPATTVQACNAAPACNGLTAPFEEMTWRAVLSHNFTSDIMGYASYNRGFKSGVYNVSAIANFAATRPEIIDAYELGLKSTLFDGRLDLNGAIYLNKYEDLQVQVTEPSTNTQRTINAAAAETSGLELESRWQATDNLILSAGLSTFFKAEYSSFENCSVFLAAAAGNQQVSGDCSGQNMPATPDLTYHVAADYSLPLASGATISVNGLYAYSDEFDMYPHAPTATRAPLQQPTETLNLSTTWRSPSERYYVSLWGRNLLDPDDTFRGLFATSFGFTTTYARGSSYGVTAGVTF